MPPIRSLPATIKPIRTERTHEENQERAYIAASRRSDRSLEARVESARRASEIHKKRTGRSLRVREEDVMNEEMYEEEDDDLPMQFRRINALNPGLAFNERLQSYLAGQIGVRNYLHQAIFQANQNQYANQFLNPMLQQNGAQPGTMSPQAMSGQYNGQPQSPYSASHPNNMQNMRPSSYGRASSIATPQELAQYQPPHSPAMASAPGTMDGRRPSMAGSTGARSASSSHAGTPHPQQVPTPPQSNQLPYTPRPTASSPPTPGGNGQMYPLTTKLPIEAQQIIHGSSGFPNPVSPSQMNAGIPMPSKGTYSYNPNGKPKKSPSGSSANSYSGLNQTLPSFNMSSQTTPPISEPQSAISAPPKMEYGFDEMYGDFGNFDTNNGFDFDLDNQGSGSIYKSGQITPASNDEVNWNDMDFFNYAAASD